MDTIKHEKISEGGQHPEKDEQAEVSAIENLAISATQIPLAQILPDSSQTRKEFPENEIEALAESIKMHGLVTPLLLKEVKDKDNKYIIIDGERRYRAISRLAEDNPDEARYKSIPVSFIRRDDPIYGLIANMARKVYNPIESAEALAYMQKHGKYSHEQLGRLVEKSRSSITEYLSLLDLPDEIKDKARSESVVPFRVLKKLAAEQISDEDKIVKYNQLHSRYKPAKHIRSRKEDAKSAWNADRLAKGFQTKVNSFIDACEKINITGIKDEKQKDKLKTALNTLMEKIQEMAEKLD